MKNKILILVFTILTFGIFLIPKTFAYNVSQLNNVNRVVGFGTFGTSDTPTIYFSYDSDNSTGVYITIQCFSNSDLNTPINLSTLGITPRFYNQAWTNMTTYTSNNNFGFRTNASITINSNYTYLVLNGASSFSDISDYVFNICIVKTYANGFIGHFVPNSYYVVDRDDYGAFSGAKTYLSLDGQSSLTDTTYYMLSYNNINLGQYTNEIYRVNNVNSYQYHLYVSFENGISIGQLPNLNIKYLELEYININGTLLSYANAKNQYSWLYTNIVLYNDSATLYTSDSAIVGYENNMIYEMRFRLPDYAFKSSSYFNSSLGLRGYLNGVKITTYSISNSEAFNNGYIEGNKTGYDKGYSEGYQRGQTEERSGFDNLMFAIADVPMHIISSMLDFNILGFNLLAFFMGIITLMLFIFIIRKFKE